MTTLKLESVQRIHNLTYSHNGHHIAYISRKLKENHLECIDNSSAPEVIINNERRLETDITNNNIRCRPRWHPHGLQEIAEIQWSPNDNIIILYDGDYCAYVHDSKTGEQIGECIRGAGQSHRLSWNKHGDAVCYVDYASSTKNLRIRLLLTGEDIITPY